MQSKDKQFLKLLGVSSAISVGLIVIHALLNLSIEFWYMLWNLFLAWVPVIFSTLFVTKRHWPRYAKTLLLFLWLLFLPNSFYVVTDLIHINDEVRLSQTLDVVVLLATVVPAFLLGLLSLWQIDRTTIQRRMASKRHLILFVISVLCGIAIYIGRELRWNSWDIITHPLSLTKDFFVAITSPASSLEFILVTTAFSVCIFTAYFLTTQFARTLISKESH